MILIYLLIAFFVSMFLYHLFLAVKNNKLIEGMDNNTTEEEDNQNGEFTYKDYARDPLILGEQNAGNITYLKQRLDDISTDSSDIDKMQTTIDALQQQVNDLGTQISELGSNMISSNPPDTSDITQPETTADVEASIAAEDDEENNNNDATIDE